MLVARAEAIDLIGQYQAAGIELLINGDRNDVETREMFVSDIVPVRVEGDSPRGDSQGAEVPSRSQAATMRTTEAWVGAPLMIKCTEYTAARHMGVCQSVGELVNTALCLTKEDGRRLPATALPNSVNRRGKGTPNWSAPLRVDRIKRQV